MKKASIICMVVLTTIAIGIAPSYAHEDGDEQHPTIKRAIHELHEAKEILEKIASDPEGHVAKALQAVDQARRELTAAK